MHSGLKMKKQTKNCNSAINNFYNLLFELFVLLLPFMLYNMHRFTNFCHCKQTTEEK